MIYIYEKDIEAGTSKLYMQMSDENRAKAKVADLNQLGLYENKFYFIRKNMQENS